MNLTTVQTALTTWAMDSSGLTRCTWANLSGNFPRLQYPFISMDMEDLVAIGEDEVRYTYDEDLDKQVPKVCGQRTFTLLVEIHSTTNSASVAPRNYLEKMRQGLRKEGVLSTLYAAGIAFVRCVSVENVPQLVDNDWKQRARARFEFRLSFNEVDANADGDYINNTQVSAEFSNSDETWTDEPMGPGA